MKQTDKTRTKAEAAVNHFNRKNAPIIKRIKRESRISPVPPLPILKKYGSGNL
jgi:hypothetical protein